MNCNRIAYEASVRTLLLGLCCVSLSAALVWGPALTVAAGVVLLILLSRQLACFPSKTSSAEMLTLFLVTGTIGFGRGFSYLGIRFEETSLYVTEAVLTAAWILVVLRKVAAKERIVKRSGLNGLFLIYYALGALCLLRGISEFGMEALRHSVVVYYSLFYFLILELVTDMNKLERILKLSLVASTVALLAIFYNYASGFGFETSTEVKRYGANIGALSLVVCVLFWLSLTVFGIRSRARSLLSVLLPFQIFAAILLIQHRSLLVALIGGLILIFALISKVRTLKYMVLMICIFLLIVCVDQFSGVLSGSVMVKDTLTRALSTLTPEQDPNSAHRLVMWSQILGRTARQPVLGEGFGPPFSVFSGGKFYDYAERRLHPHNSFLWILNRMGVIGFGIFCCLILKFYASGIKAYRRMEAGKSKAYLLALLSSHFCISIFAFFNVVLEGPSMGIFFWIIMGMSMALIKIEKERSEELKYESGT
ncbi:MAG: O-antigen ligase family protein [Candidatus Zixiibacteriota bacterium]|nr:MAG: O-antigen ligase family protein [candidate division Zixibacteria bacterium]